MEELVRMIDYGFESAFLDASMRRRFRAEAMEVRREIRGRKE